MAYQIDQSGKIEQTNLDTVIACTNGTAITLLFKKGQKRKLENIFKVTDNRKLFPYLTFAALVALLLYQLQPKHRLIIDREYLGHEPLIEAKVMLYFEQLGLNTLPPITFGHVGKLSAAHNLAYQVASGKQKPTIVVDAKEVMKVILGTKKIGTA